MRKFFLIGSLLVLSSTALSAPTISKATLSDSGIEIIGANFGNDNPMLFWDDPSESFDESNVQLLDLVPKLLTSKWGDNAIMSGEGFRFFKSSESKTGKSDIFYRGTGHKTFLGIPNHRMVESLKNKLFVSWWYKPGLSPFAEGGSNKFIRIWDNSNGSGTRISWTHMHFTCHGDRDHTKWGSWENAGQIGQWNHHAIYIDLNEQTAKAWVNGTLIINSECTKHPDYTDTPLYVGALGFDHGSEGYRNMTTALDDIYIGSSQARVEISESPTWSSVMVKEILPISSWSNSRIVTKLYEGVVKHSKNVYVYVIDEDGKSNTQGMQVQCGNCPKAVTD